MQNERSTLRHRERRSHFSPLTSHVPAFLAAIALSAPLATFAQDAKIVVHADRPGATLTHYLTGACIEDVNHEIYGEIGRAHV